MSQRIRMAAALAAVVVVASAFGAPVAAQVASEAGAKWTAWLGCWEPVLDATAGVDVTARNVTCVIPSEDADVAEVITVVDGEVAERGAFDASGARSEFERDGCTGWERMEWSADGRRAYRHSEYECPGPFRRTASGLITMLRGDVWLSVNGVAAGEAADVRVVRYRPTAAPEAVRGEMERAIAGRALQVDAARIAFAAPAGVEEVIEATRSVHPAVVEGWLIEQGQGFGLDADRLIALDEADVPASVIDLMVALSNPTVFAVNREARAGEFRRDEPAVASSAFQTGASSLYAPVYFDPFFYDPLYDSRWGYRDLYYGSRYGFGTGWYGRPIIIVREPGDDGSDPSTTPRGRVVNGRGYTRGGAPSDGGEPSRVARPRSPGASPSAGSPSAAPGGGVGAPASNGGGGSSGGSPEGRTAKPRSAG